MYMAITTTKVFILKQVKVCLEMKPEEPNHKNKQQKRKREKKKKREEEMTTYF